MSDEKSWFQEIHFLFPEGKDKALTFSYDDAQVYDRRLVSIFDQHDMKATFHLNSSTLDREGFVTRSEIKQLYVNHEIACHGVTHPFFNQLSQAQTVTELYEDRRALEQYSGRIVRGFSYPFGVYSDNLIETALKLGIVYSRTVNSTMDFALPTDFMRWNPTCHHDQVTDELLADFLNPPPFRGMALLYIWGHSYEFERDGKWAHIHGICEKLQGRKDIWYATNIEIYDYVTAVRGLIMSVDGHILYNASARPVWFMTSGKMYCLAAGEQMSFD